MTPNKDTEVITRVRKILKCGLLSSRIKVDLCKDTLKSCEKVISDNGTLFEIGHKAVVIPKNIDTVLFFEEYNRAVNYFIKINS